MPINFNPIAQQPNLVDILDQLLSGSNTVTSAAPLPAQLISNPTGPAPSEQAPDSQTLLNLFKPEHSASDAYMNILRQFPQRNQPTKTQNILGLIAGLGAGVKPVGIAGNQIVGFQGGKPEEIMQAQDLIRYRPFYQQLEDWQSKVKPYEAAAVNEKNLNNTMRMMLYDAARTGNQATAIENRRTNEAEKRAIDWTKLDESAKRTKIQEQLANNPNYEIYAQPDGNLLLVDKKSGATEDTGYPSNKAGEIKVVNARHQARLSEIAAGGTEARKTVVTRAQADPRKPIFTDAAGKNWQQDPISKDLYEVQVGTGPTPVDMNPPKGFTIPPTETPPTKQTTPKGVIPAPMPTGTPPAGPTGALTKLGAKATDTATAQTRAMAEFARAQLDSIPRLRTQAKALEQAGLFGTVNSRLAGLAGKLGTTGDYEVDGDLMRQIGDSLSKDGVQLSNSDKTSDRLLGQFLMNIGLTASGAGAVHARGRTGIQIIEYMKQLLSPMGSRQMFEGRLDELEARLKKYASLDKPPGATQKNEQTADDDFKKRIKAALDKMKLEKQ